jgi:two-component system OmpR family response regulator
MNPDKVQYGAKAQPHEGRSAIHCNSPGAVADAKASLRPHILAIDDDPRNRELIAEYLGQNDLRITAVPNGPAVQSALQDEVVDLVLLDLKRRTEDAVTLAQRLRDLSAIPLIILTDRAEEADMVMGLEMGADDYLAKPVSPRELIARIRAVLRRHRAQMCQGRPAGVRGYRFDGWELNLGTRRLKARDGRHVSLTNGDFNVLVALLGSSPRILTRDQIIDLSRLHNDEVFDRSVDIQIGRLRRKIESDPTEPRYVRTERGAGYRFAVPVQTV